MIEYLLYLLKVSACIIVFYIFYIIFLRNCTFFKLNRIYLLSGMILSFIIPIFKITMIGQHALHVLPNLFNSGSNGTEGFNYQPFILSKHTSALNYPLLLTVIYFAGLSVLFFRLLFSIHRTIGIRYSAEIGRLGKQRIVKMETGTPFSFFNTIFLPKNESNPLIIGHEETHIRQFHWVDLLLTELVSTLLWFNPFVILYKSSLKLLHEYLADNSVLTKNNQVEKYLGCLLNRVQVIDQGGLQNHFYCKTIKKRIIMITKNKTAIHYKAIYLLIFPIVCLLLYAFTGNNSKKVYLADNKITSSANEYQPSIYPVEAEKISKTMGYGDRIHPFSKKKVFHYAIDFALPLGEKVLSTAKGNVLETSSDSNRGIYILIKHNNEYSTFYSHLKSVEVKAGDKLELGQTIGYVGSTGLSTGPHVHYEVIKNGERVNPTGYLPK